MALGSAWAWMRGSASRVGSNRPFALGLQTARYLLQYGLWLPVIAYVKANVADLAWIKGPSMYPFFNPQFNQTLRQDVCLSVKWNAQDKLERGMIVEFWAPHDPNKISVKRVIGLEGDIIRTRKGSFVHVPQGYIWVEGDGGASLSRDSNNYGPISRRLIRGRLTRILYPFHRAGRIRWEEHEHASIHQRAQRAPRFW
ncbi:hypothetical protein GGTG_08372 [Gaeumannomyces tritici R3-111a-1]|uniref:Peptidase S26 domain-containing protein n=1 Tax=Gaeumannomyces tritici (strain R3-111a-1) TaxID=644352 RepID=J3P4D6_GAET3|nr:hypothetical protein GGTG_08372 [Gaeumannomyces tritici R3-111a-1]EJT74532.1 hypothetical protein GGTG_08372 [Gaeumannomyces tritici R3-111a-1]